MIHTMTRSKVQNTPTPDLEQTAVQSPGAVMPTSSRQQRSLKGSKERQPKKRCHTCLKHESERGQESSTRLRQSPPTARYKIKSTKTAQPHSAERRNLAQFKSVGTAARVQCKREREASRIRRAVAPDRRANDIAKQVTTTREEVIRTREGK